jgi:hypothetical protein
VRTRFWREEDTDDFGGSTMTIDLGIVGPRRRAALRAPWASAPLPSAAALRFQAL